LERGGYLVGELVLIHEVGSSRPVPTNVGRTLSV